MFRNLDPSAIGISGRQSEAIELALSYGFKGISLDIGEFQQAVAAHGLPHARRLIDSARLKLGTFCLPLVWDEDDDVYKQGTAALEQVLELAAGIGLTRAVTTIAPANDLRPYHENFEFHRRRLGEIGAALAGRGMKLGLACCIDPALRHSRAYQFIHSFDALVTLVGMIRASNVGVVADLFQMHVAGVGLEELRKLGGERIVAVILSDAPAGKTPAECTEAERLLPGETGTIDPVATLTALAEMGYDGPVTPAASPETLRGKKRDEIVKLAGQRLTQAWSSMIPAGAKPAAAHG